MKLSLKVQDQHHHQKNLPLLLRAKVPITVLGLPFLSDLTAAAAVDHHPSLSFRTNFPSGPSLKLSYSPSTSTTAAAAAAATPITLTLKSGISLSGSPNNSPLTISAHFSLSPHNPNPTFSLQFKPRLGDFSFRKTILSNPSPNSNGNGEGAGNASSYGFVPLDKSDIWKDLSMEKFDNKSSILSGVAVMANTKLPVTKRVGIDLRWGVNFPGEFGKRMPVLSVNKIGIERIDEVEEVEKEKRREGNVGDLEMLKGMYSWMGKELDVLRSENREMKRTLEEMKSGKSLRNGHVYGNGNGAGKKPAPVVKNSSGFDQWRNKKSGGEENGGNELKKNANRTTDVESELQRAIKAASS